MKKLVLLIATILCLGSCSNGQEKSFKSFISYFSIMPLPFTVDNFSEHKGELVPPDLAFLYLCKGDSSLLTFESVGINHDTQEVVYRKLKSYEYKAYARIQIENYYLLIYDGYVTDGYHEFTKVIDIGVFRADGELISEMPFYVFDDMGKLEEQSGTITEDFQILIKKKVYFKNEKGVFTRSYKEITETYEIEKRTGKFIMTDEIVTVFDKSK
jgi:hypothetical protein